MAALNVDIAGWAPRGVRPRWHGQSSPITLENGRPLWRSYHAIMVYIYIKYMLYRDAMLKETPLKFEFQGSSGKYRNKLRMKLGYEHFTTLELYQY